MIAFKERTGSYPPAIPPVHKIADCENPRVFASSANRELLPVSALTVRFAQLRASASGAPGN